MYITGKLAELWSYFPLSGSAIHFAHRDVVSVNHVPINDLLEIAGVPLVTFEKDLRVTNIT